MTFQRRCIITLWLENTDSGGGMGGYLPISTPAWGEMRLNWEAFPSAWWLREDSGGRVCSRKCALTEGGGDSLPIRGVFSHRGF